jgi:hypothetical protein
LFWRLVALFRKADFPKMNSVLTGLEIHLSGWNLDTANSLIMPDTIPLLSNQEKLQAF